MARLKQLINRIRHEERLPTVISDRCVHTLIEVASCKSCVDACPRQAWFLDDEALQFDTTLCDGCGLCVPVCPQRAITIQYDILIGDLGQEKVALCACEQSGISDNKSTLPCIHLIGLSDILKLYRQGYYTWVTTTGSCAECQRGHCTTLFERIEQINRALIEEQNPVIVYHQIEDEQWQRIQSRLDDKTPSPSLSRRAFLTEMLDSGIDSTSALFKLNEQEADAHPPPGELLPNQGETSIWPYVPKINSNNCDGCDACVNTCPHNAIELTAGDDKASYRIKPQACTGCAICQDICDRQAITIMEWSQMAQQILKLQTFTCSRCGNPAHTPAAITTQSLCRICSQVNHHRNLFQVMD
ncbi:MAG: hypothetical protein B6D77_02700 [gamma proteobacterium symbiont of Ctena orbiculata]|nr:MAG: hypothetical protein B6D77_02700 [gamma proteobacterium symbiont of Ctena orbiculata]PVV17857.1 MAG: hypothetical protein B6D78_17675 [gamma proteobacterium symbiont of Ctena orbiculata]